MESICSKVGKYEQKIRQNTELIKEYKILQDWESNVSEYDSVLDLGAKFCHLYKLQSKQSIGFQPRIALDNFEKIQQF